MHRSRCPATFGASTVREGSARAIGSNRDEPPQWVVSRLSPRATPKIELRRFQPFAGRAEPRGLAAGSGYFADAPLIVPIDNLWWRVPITL